MKIAITVSADVFDKDSAEKVRDEVAGGLQDAKDSGELPYLDYDVGPVVEIETCQLVGIKDGREVDLGDIPLTPEMKAREIARSYHGDIEDEDGDGALMLGAMKELINWMKEQGKLK